jgi:hypothetical protein
MFMALQGSNGLEGFSLTGARSEEYGRIIHLAAILPARPELGAKTAWWRPRTILQSIDTYDFS